MSINTRGAAEEQKTAATTQDILNKIKSLNQNKGLLKPTSKKEVAGLASTTRFYETALPVQHISEDQKEESLKALRIAKTEIRDDSPDQDEYKKLTYAALELLRQHNIPHPYLYYDKDGVRLSEEAKGFDDFVEENQGKLEIDASYANIIWQFIYKIERLHHANLVHRDVKLQNLLIMPTPELCLEPIDFDGLIKVTPAGIAIDEDPPESGTPMMMSPELRNAIIKKISLKTANLTAIDCYAVGASLLQSLRLLKGTSSRYYLPIPAGIDLKQLGVKLNKDLVSELRFLYALLPRPGESFENNPELRIYDDLFKLIVSLLQEDPQKRATLAQAMDSPFFRAFPKLPKKSDYKVIISDEAVPLGTITPGNAFYFLPKPIKHIVRQAEAITEEANKPEVTPEKVAVLQDKLMKLQQESVSAPPEFASHVSELNQSIGLDLAALIAKPQRDKVDHMISDIILTAVDYYPELSTELTDLQSALSDAIFDLSLQTAKPDSLFSAESKKELAAIRALLDEQHKNRKKFSAFALTLLQTIETTHTLSKAINKHLLNSSQKNLSGLLALFEEQPTLTIPPP